MKLQILQWLKGIGTSTDTNQRDLVYLRKVGEIEYEQMDEEVLLFAKEVTDEYDLKNEIRFHKEPEDRLPWDDDKTNIV